MAQKSWPSPAHEPGRGRLPSPRRRARQRHRALSHGEGLRDGLEHRRRHRRGHHRITARRRPQPRGLPRPASRAKPGASPVRRDSGLLCARWSTRRTPGVRRRVPSPDHVACGLDLVARLRRHPVRRAGTETGDIGRPPASGRRPLPGGAIERMRRRRRPGFSARVVTDSRPPSSRARRRWAHSAMPEAAVSASLARAKLTARSSK